MFSIVRIGGCFWNSGDPDEGTMPSLHFRHESGGLEGCAGVQDPGVRETSEPRNVTKKAAGRRSSVEMTVWYLGTKLSGLSLEGDPMLGDNKAIPPLAWGTGTSWQNGGVSHSGNSFRANFGLELKSSYTRQVHQATRLPTGGAHTGLTGNFSSLLLLLPRNGSF